MYIELYPLLFSSQIHKKINICVVHTHNSPVFLFAYTHVGINKGLCLDISYPTRMVTNGQGLARALEHYREVIHCR